MLQQILRDMHVDKEILAGLDETQKQTLFCKMREEQVRRWRIWDAAESPVNLKLTNKDSLTNNKRNRNVQFLKAADGDDWVWIMGEHENDMTIEEIFALEARLNAQKLAEIETSELRKSVQAELTEMLEFDSIKSVDTEDEMTGNTPTINEVEIYCSVDDLKEKNFKSKQPNQEFLKNQTQNDTVACFDFTKSNERKNIHKDFEKNRQQVSKVTSTIWQWEKRLIGEKTCEILLKIQKSQEQKLLEAEEAAKKQEELWKEQERKSKEAEIQRRNIARVAREEHRRSVYMLGDTGEIESFSQIKLSNETGLDRSPLSSLDVCLPKPSSQEAVIKWYQDEEYIKGAGIDNDDNKNPAKWFHGLITRKDAEDILQNKTADTFLVRISEKIWGYVISYKTSDRCKHYLVDVTNGKYQFLGANQLSHDSLDHLIKYHCDVPITLLGNELLKEPCVAVTNPLVNLITESTDRFV